MNVKSKKLISVSLMGMILVSACGGSSDDGAGQLSDFQAGPTEVSYATGTSNCPNGDKIGDVTLIGGTAPYRISNPNNNFIGFGPGLSTTTPAFPGSNYTVSNRNQQVAVFAFGCFSGDVVVRDAQQRVLTFTVSAASGSGS